MRRFTRVFRRIESANIRRKPDAKRLSVFRQTPGYVSPTTVFTNDLHPATICAVAIC